MTERSVLVRLKADISQYNREMLRAAAGAKAFTKELDTSTDRATNFTQSVLAIGPALIPIGAGGVPAIAGLTNQMAFAAVGAGTAALAFSGVGDALKATTDYAVEPTAANFAKLQDTLSTLGPAGREFVAFLQELRPQLQGLQDSAQAGLFPGVEAGLTDIMDLLPQAERIVTQVSSGLGEAIAEAGDNLNDPRWVEFFTFLEHEAKPTLLDMGRTLGNFAEGFANLWMAFDPLSDQFSKSFLEMSRDFAKWTDGLSQTEGFQEFVDYIERVGPKAWDTLASLGNALLQIVEAAAPVSEVSLPIIKILADTLALIADSPVGPILVGAAAGISAISRAVALYNTANGSAMSQMLTGLRGSGPYLKGAAAGVGILALSLTDLDDKMGISNTATLGLAGAVAGPWGAAVGAGVGLAMDFAAANDGVSEAVSKANAVLADSGSSYTDQIAAIDAAIAKIDEYQDSLTGDMSGVGDFLKSYKDGVEDIFGKSDYDENAGQRAKLIEQRKAVADAARDQRIAEAGLTQSMHGTSEATRDQVDAIVQLINAHNRLADETLANADANIAYEQALDDAAKASRENKKGLDANTQVGRDNLSVLGDLASKWNNLSEEQQNAKGASDRVRRSFIAAAIQMGATKKRARELAEEYLHMPTDVSTTVHSNAPKVTKQIQDLINKLHAIPELTETTIRTIKDTYLVTHDAPRNSTLAEMLHPADGGLIVGPGGPRDDMIPAMVSNGEFVVNAAATAKHLPELFAMNAQKFATGGLVQHFADYSGARPVHMGGGTTTIAAPQVTVMGGLNKAELKSVLKEVLSNGSVRIVGKPGNQRLEIMGG